MPGKSNTTHVSIRDFHYPEDYSRVITLWKAAGQGIQVRRSDQPDQIEKKLQRDPDLFLVAEANGEIIGSVVGGFDGRRGLIYHLAVQASHREQGIGSQLMQEIEARLRAKGCIRSYLMVTTDNQSATGFYERRGWERMDYVVTYGKDLG
jgi:ribosomal protein S18 acetylase RimI-like enzyme